MLNGRITRAITDLVLSKIENSKISRLYSMSNAINTNRKAYYFEALLYEQYPYKKEIDTFLKYEKASHDSFPRQKKSIKPLTKKDKQMLHKYFRNLKHEHMNTIDLGEV